MEFQFDHIAMVVPDIADAVRWYKTTFPATEELYVDVSWAFLLVNGARIALVLRDEHPGHVAWRVSEVKLNELAELHGKSVSLHRDGTKSFYLEAPGNNSIEIITFDNSDWEM